MDIMGDKRQSLLYGLEGAQSACAKSPIAPLLRVISMTIYSKKLDICMPSMIGNAEYARSCVFTYEDQCLYNHLSKCILYVLCNTLRHSDRVYIIRSLDIINQISMMPGNGIVMNHLPENVIHDVCNLLYCNITTADPSRFFMDNEHYVCNSHAPSSNRLPGLSITHNYYADMNDSEMRDIVLETIYSLCHYSMHVREVVAHIPLFLEFIITYMEYLHKNNSTLSAKRELLNKGLGKNSRFVYMLCVYVVCVYVVCVFS